MLSYQKDDNLSDEKIAEKVKLSATEVEDILFCEIEKFTLDRLITYASKLLDPVEVNITVEQKRPELHT